MPQKNIITVEELKKRFGPSKLEDIVLVGGCFDVIHLGHIRFLNAAKKAGKTLVVLLESDEFIVTRKKRKPVHTQEQRAEVLAALRDVDIVVKLPFILHDETYTYIVSTIKPAVIAVTKGDSYLCQKQKQAKKIGATISQVIPFVKSFSSSQIIGHGTHRRD